MLIAVGIGIGFLLWTFDGIVLNFGDLGLLQLLAAWTPVPVIAAIAGSIVLHDHGSGRAGHPVGCAAMGRARSMPRLPDVYTGGAAPAMASAWFRRRRHQHCSR